MFSQNLQKVGRETKYCCSFCFLFSQRALTALHWDLASGKLDRLISSGMMLVAAKQIKITPFLDKHIINSSYTISAASDNTYHDDARSECFRFLPF